MIFIFSMTFPVPIRAYLEICQAFIMEPFAQIVSIFLSLTIFITSSIIDVSQNLEYAFASHFRDPEGLLTVLSISVKTNALEYFKI